MVRETPDVTLRKEEFIGLFPLPAFRYALGCKRLQRHPGFQKTKVPKAVLLLFYPVILS